MDKSAPSRPAQPCVIERKARDEVGWRSGQSHTKSKMLQRRTKSPILWFADPRNASFASVMSPSVMQADSLLFVMSTR